MDHLQRKFWQGSGIVLQRWRIHCIAGFSVVACVLLGTDLVRAQNGVRGVPTQSVAPAVASAAEAEMIAPAAADGQHERGYPINLEAARQMPRAAGPGPSEVLEMAPPKAQAIQPLAPALGTKFEGIGATGFIPADPMLAVGRQRIIQVVNSTLRITTRTGTSAQTATLAATLGVPSGSNGILFDPRVQHDHFANRFVVLALARNAAKTDSWYIVAVSKTETPTTAQSSWNRYFLRSDIDGSTNTASWGDYAPIGFDNTNFYITSNQFNASGTFLRSKIRQYAKAPFYAGGTVSGLEWNNVTDSTGAAAFTIQPAVTFGAPGHQWLASVPFGTGNRLSMFRITSNQLFKSSVTIGSTSLPDLARQKGSATRIHSGDNRLLNAVFSNNRFYTCHTVKSGSFACAARYLGVNTASVNSPTKSMDRVIGFATADYYYPALATNPAASASTRICTVFNFSATDRFPGILYTQMREDGTTQPLGLLKEGLNSYVSLDSSGRNRWGDYNGIARDPLNSNQFFFNAMYARSTANTWGTFVGSTTVSTTTSPSTGPAGIAGVAIDGTGPTQNSGSLSPVPPPVVGQLLVPAPVNSRGLIPSVIDGLNPGSDPLAGAGLQGETVGQP